MRNTITVQNQTVNLIKYTSVVNFLADAAVGVDSSDTLDAQVDRHLWNVENAAELLATAGMKAGQLQRQHVSREAAVTLLEREAAAIAQAL